MAVDMSKINAGMNKEDIEIANMYAELEQYYEAARFEDFAENVLMNATDDEIRSMHSNLYTNI